MSTKFKVNYTKQKLIDLTILGNQFDTMNADSEYKPYNINNLQFYNPLYNKYFTMTENNYNNFTFEHKYYISDLHHVIEDNNKIVKDVFIKFSPLLDPYRYMIGKYDIDDENLKKLPTINSNESNTHSKIISIHNASYVDSFFCFLTSTLLNKHNIVHGVEYYGSFLGIQEKFKINIVDDLEYLRNSDFFNENIGKLFFVEDSENDFSLNPFGNVVSSRKNKKKLCFLENDDVTIECNELPEINTEDNNVLSELETIYTKEQNDSSSVSSDSSSELNYSTEEDDDEESSEDSSEDSSEESSDESSDEEEELFAYINEFPVQVICMEKCDGTVDKLFCNDEIDDKIGASLLFQVVITLLIYQKMFKFTHNDLHTNNIMYVNTDQEFLFYKYNNKTYKVPTYGKIYKLIDFGRAIFKVNDSVFCSDSFAKDGDATTQYNCEPFFNSNRPRLEPNSSFDLCRLGSSLFDFIMDIDDDEEELDELQKTVKRWCEDDNGKNILYKKNGQERYPSFKLYKMIARSVHKHTPDAQLEYDFFKQFLSEETDANIINIDELPIYYK